MNGQERNAFRLMIADRNAAWRSLAGDVLCRCHYKVFSVSTWDDLEVALTTGSYDLVLIGYDLVQRHIGQLRELALRAENPVRFVVLIAIRQTYEVLHPIWKAGVRDIRPKPQLDQMRELTNIVVDELGGECNSAGPMNGNCCTFLQPVVSA